MNSEKEILDDFEILKKEYYGGISFFVGKKVNDLDRNVYIAGHYDIAKKVHGNNEYVIDMTSINYSDVILHFHQAIANEIIETEKTNIMPDNGTIKVNQCHSKFDCQTLKGEVIAIDPYVLPKEYQRIDKQVYLAVRGLGCNPHGIGETIYAINLFSGEKTRIEKNIVYGVVRQEYIPPWANKKLEELNYCKTKKDKGVER